VLAAIFGSVARRRPDPGDCDLLVVIDRPTDHGGWKAISAAKSDIRKRFLRTWKIPLTIMVLTREEASEKTACIRTLLGGKLISIAGSQTQRASRGRRKIVKGD
jgi:predicted nucleotidyltransferase